jgi:transcriptional regulator GlxA family with amidase domain
MSSTHLQTRTEPFPNAVKGVRRRVSKARLSVGFILAKRFTLCAFANFVDVLRLAADEGDRSRPILCEWTVLSANMNAVTSSCGIDVQPKERLGDPSRFDYIVVVGGLINETPSLGAPYERFLHAASEARVPLVGVCTGAFMLHQAGLLDGYRCCVSWFHHADLLEQYEGLKPVSDQIFVVDRDRLTCSGGASSAHLAAHLVNKHVGRAQANKSLRIMIIDEPLQENKPQPGITMDFKTKDPIVLRALLLMQQNIDEPYTVAEVAEKIGHSKRQLERHFQSALNTSPQAAFLSMRLSLAHYLVTTSDRSISQIALECGFCDASHLSRMFRRRFNSTPQTLRKTGTAAP